MIFLYIIMMNIPAVRSFFTADSVSVAGLVIHGIGIDEPMPVFMVDRPAGTGDFLMMQFHSPTIITIDGEELPISPDTLMIWPPGVMQKYGYSKSRKIPWTHSWIHLDGRRVHQYISETNLATNKPLGPFEPSIFKESLYRVYLEITRNPIAENVILANLLQNMFHELKRILSAQENTEVIPAGIISAKSQIEQNAGENITLDELADISGYSVPHFCSLFKKHFNISPIAYATQLRMQRAIYFLRDKNKQITQIAHDLGYKDVYHFSKRFKEYFGSPPNHVRKRLSR